jgi:cell wall-associated NlpC family hydrolase
MPRATLRARLGVTAASLFIGLGIAAVPAASAATNTGNSPVAAGANNSPANADLHRSQHANEVVLIKHHDVEVRHVIREARRQKGKPYVYGADGPRAFDCSGLVRYVFMHATHRVLPHNAAQQYDSLRHITRRRLRPGDLIFTDNGYISHVGIFAGHGHWWVAPHTGTHVQLQRIYSAHFVYARVLVIHKR